MHSLNFLTPLFLAATAVAAPPKFVVPPYNPRHVVYPSESVPSTLVNPTGKPSAAQEAGTLLCGSTAANTTHKIFVCEHWNWGGKCEHKFSPLGGAPNACTQLDGTASSIGPDEGFTCRFYKTGHCDDVPGQPAPLVLSYPGSSNLLETPQGDYNDAIRSYTCFLKET